MGIEDIAEIRRRRIIHHREVPELVKVLLQLRYAVDLGASLRMEQSREFVPRGVVSFGGYFSYSFGYGSGGKAGAGKQGDEEEKIIIGITTQRNHNFGSIEVWPLEIKDDQRDLEPIRVRRSACIINYHKL